MENIEYLLYSGSLRDGGLALQEGIREKMTHSTIFYVNIDNTLLYMFHSGELRPGKKMKRGGGKYPKKIPRKIYL